MLQVSKKIRFSFSWFSGYIKPLLDLAEMNIPTAKQATTPVFLFATAGMRLLPDE